jgi:uncharacterized SAM-binding protein YcdF (DUF218 family)
MATFKLALDGWLLPLPIGLILISLGLLARLSARPRAARALLLCGMAVALTATLNPVGRSLLLPLESRYKAVRDASSLSPVPRYVVVLGSGYQPRDGLSVTAALGPDAVIRLAEGIRLYRQLPDAALIVSGGALHGDPPASQGYALAAVALGVPAASIVQIDSPVNTGEEIRAVRSRVGDATVLLVTSAAHMPRAMAYCRRMGLRAIAAPTGNLVDPEGRGPQWIPLPSGAALRKTDAAVHEYLGLLALNLGIL